MPQQRESRDVEQPQRREAETRNHMEPKSQQGGLTTRSPSLLSRGFGDPFATMNTLQREMERLLDNFGFGGMAMRPPFFSRAVEGSELPLWSPQVEIYEKDGKLHVRADLPGLAKNDVHGEM